MPKRNSDAAMEAVAAHDNAAACPNCGQWQRGPSGQRDCLNECIRRGFAAEAWPLTIHAGSVGEWPFPVMQANPDAWVEISLEHRDYCLEVLPPYYFKGGFAVSEPQNHTAEGVPVYACVVTIWPRHFVKHLTLAQAEAEAPLLRAMVKP